MRHIAIVLLACFAFCATGCTEYNPMQPATGCDNCPTAFLALDARDHVLHNLERAYNTRNFDEYARLIDRSGAFRFYFSQRDIDAGNASQPYWGADEELASTQALLDPDPPPGRPRADHIELTLSYAEGDDDWQAFTPASHPTETWYSKPVEYRLYVSVGNQVFAQNRPKTALFVVRLNRVEGRAVWQIVTWHDDIGD